MGSISECQQKVCVTHQNQKSPNFGNQVCIATKVAAFQMLVVGTNLTM